MTTIYDRFDLLSLSPEEIKFLFRKISIQDIRNYFEKYPVEFSKIRSGFRPRAISYDDAIELLCKNISKPFVFSFAKKWITIWMEQIAEDRSSAEKKGASFNEALLRAVSKSVFSENVDLFFKLSEESFSVEYISVFKTFLPHLNLFSNQSNAELNNNSKADQMNNAQEISHLKERIVEHKTLTAQIKDDLEHEKQAHLEKITLLGVAESKNRTLAQELEDAKSQLQSFSSTVSEMESELKDLRRLSGYADIEPAANNDAYDYVSICQIVKDSYDQIRLARLADIIDGKIVKFEKNVDELPYFRNRTHLYWQNGPCDEGFIGIWQWKTIPNRNDSNKDFVIVNYTALPQIIEVIELYDCHSCDDLVQYLTTHSITLMLGRKYLFVVRNENGTMEGLLCCEKDFEVVGEKRQLKQSVITLPLFSIAPSDILTFRGIQVFGHTSLGIPQKLCHIRTPSAIVKDIVLSYATSSVLRQQGLSKKEAQHCQLFLNSLPTDTIYKEVTTGLGCTDDEAHSLIDDFVVQAATYLNKSDVEVTLLSEAIGRNPDLVAQCKDMLTEEWENEHKEKLVQAKESLAVAAAAKEACERAVCDLTTKQKKLEQDIAEMECTIEAKMALANDVEEKVAARICAARQNAAEFICEMAFVTGDYGAVQKTKENKQGTWISRKILNTVQGDSITNIESFEDELADNLEISGYGKLYAIDMAQMITIGICNRMPMVINENAHVIADCIAAMFDTSGAYHAHLSIHEANYPALFPAMDEIATDGYHVCIISGVFDGFSLNAFHAIYQRMRDNTILVFALNGVSAEMLPASVWNQALYIDGEIGIENTPHKKLKCFSCDTVFEKDCDVNKIKECRKTLRYFKNIVGNLALMNCAKFMSQFPITLKNSMLLQLQLAIAAKSNGTNDALADAFNTVGITSEAISRISKYL